MALVKHLAFGHTVQRQVAQIVWPGIRRNLRRRQIGKVGAGDNRLHPRQSPRALGIDRYDPGVSMRAALDAAPQHAGHSHVGPEIGSAGDLVDAVGADRSGADYPKRGLIEIAHLPPPSSRTKPDMTLRTV